MPTTQTVLFPPPVRGTALSKQEQLYLATLQYLLPLREVDTSAGPYTEALPPAGLDSSTGQSNQNQEITFVKVSADGNPFTLTGAANGPFVLTVQYGFAKFKSDGSRWLRTG